MASSDTMIIKFNANEVHYGVPKGKRLYRSI